jgi:hypothetical protein
MLGYMALVIRMDSSYSIEKIHELTYSNAKQNIPPEEYNKLTETPAYRKRFETNPSEFKKILPNYIVKPLYTWLCWLFYKSGFSLPIATALPSLISYLLLGLFLFHWSSKYVHIGIAFLGAVLIMDSTIVTAIARLSTPDCLSALFLLVGSYFILERRNTFFMFIFSFLSILTRVDNIITCFIIISFLTFSLKWKTIPIKQYFIMLAILFATYVLIILPVTQFGWSIFYYGQYARHIDYSRDFDQPITLSTHFSLMYSKLTTAFISTHFTFFAFLGLLVFVSKNFSFRNLSFDQTFLLVLILIGLIKFLLLPDLSDRFHLAFFLVIIILLIRKLNSQILMPPNEDR